MSSVLEKGTATTCGKAIWKGYLHYPNAKILISHLLVVLWLISDIIAGHGQPLIYCEGNKLRKTAKGTFEIVMKPAPVGEGAGRVAVGRMLIDKEYSGDMVGQGQGEMLSAGNPAAGSAGYVAIEHVTAMLDGRSGSFALQHSGVMHEGDSQLSISVVPGSGTGDLFGLEGSCKISIVEGQHFYELEYAVG